MSKEIREQIDRVKNWKQSLNESRDIIKENYNLQKFKNDFNGEEFFEPFLQAIENKGLDINKQEVWDKIIAMDRKELRNTFDLTIGTGIKLYNSLQNKINSANPNTVDGRAARLNDFFKTPGTAGDYAEFKAINNHFKEGGDIENLEPSLKRIYKTKYEPFTKEQFMEIFEKVKDI